MSYKFFFFASALNLFYYVPNVLASPVIGGVEDTFHNLKYHVAIQEIPNHRRLNSAILVCGGAIIDDRYILTAAHCFVMIENGEIETYHQLSTSRMVVLAGTSETYGPGIIVEVSKVYIPHEYDMGRERYGGDLAVVQLANDLNVAQNTDRLQILPLDPGRPFNVYENNDAFVPGNGCHTLHTGDDGVLRPEPNRFPARRQVIRVRMVARSVLTYYFHHAISVFYLNTSQIHTCSFGDSGSPLVYDGTIIGVLSRSPERFRPSGYVMIFTRVWAYITFIRNAMNPNGDHSQMYRLEYQSQ